MSVSYKTVFNASKIRGNSGSLNDHNVHLPALFAYCGPVLEQIVNFGTNRILNTYSIVRIEGTEYRVITRSQKTI